jgi:carboxyl-terminal processing protease
LFAGASVTERIQPTTSINYPSLSQEPQHATVSERVTSRFTRSHYRQFALDADFSGKIFARYLNMLDYNHNVLLASDVAQFKDRETTLDDELKSGQLDTLMRCSIWLRNVALNDMNMHFLCLSHR